MKHPNEGARLLALALAKEQLTHREAAAAVKGGSISRYLSGVSVPDLERALALEDRFGISTRAWFKEVARPKLTKQRNRQSSQTTRQGARP